MATITRQRTIPARPRVMHPRSPTFMAGPCLSMKAIAPPLTPPECPNLPLVDRIIRWTERPYYLRLYRRFCWGKHDRVLDIITINIFSASAIYAVLLICWIRQSTPLFVVDVRRHHHAFHAPLSTVLLVLLVRCEEHAISLIGTLTKFVHSVKCSSSLVDDQ